jgi:membrane protein implicated in regulation of membrane protease activity
MTLKLLAIILAVATMILVAISLALGLFSWYLLRIVERQEKQISRRDELIGRQNEIIDEMRSKEDD